MNGSTYTLNLHTSWATHTHIYINIMKLGERRVVLSPQHTRVILLHGKLGSTRSNYKSETGIYDCVTPYLDLIDLMVV